MELHESRVTFVLYLMLHALTNRINCTSCQMSTHYNSTLIIHYTYIKLHSMQREKEKKRESCDAESCPAALAQALCVTSWNKCVPRKAHEREARTTRKECCSESKCLHLRNARKINNVPPWNMEKTQNDTVCTKKKTFNCYVQETPSNNKGTHCLSSCHWHQPSSCGPIRQRH